MFRNRLKITLLLAFILLVISALLFNKKISAQENDSIKTKEIEEDKFYVPKLSLQNKQILTYEEKDCLTNQDKEYISRVIYPELKIYVLGFHWEGEENSDNDIRIQVRFLNKDESFTEWFDVDKSFNEFGKGNNISIQTSEPVIAPESIGFQYKVKLKKDSPSLLDNLNFICIDSSRSKVGKAEKKLFNQAEAAEITGINIISRAGWGCPQAGYSPDWPPEYVPWQKVVIHHTAGSNYVPDPAGTVRGIWQYHTYEAKWIDREGNVHYGFGDIGYNFLVSPDGQMFEGRFGGKNVVGGHAYPYNYGTIGISVLGTYTSVPISNQAFESLTSLIAQKSYESGFPPAGSSNFTNSYGQTWYNMPNIVGHRDCAPTECPGQAFYNQLPVVRSVAQSKYPQYFSYKLYKTNSSHTVYLIDLKQNKKFAFPSLELFNNWGLSWSRLEIVSESVLNSVPDGGIITNLAKGSIATVYLMDQGKKKPLPDMNTFNAWGFKTADIRTYSDDLISSISSGSNVTNLAKGSIATVYLMDQGKKKPLPDMNTFNAWGFKTADIRTYSDDLIANNKLTNSPSSGPTVTKLAKGSIATVYLMDQGKKKPLPDMNTFNAWGFKTADIRTYSDTLINSISTGSNVTDLAKGSSATVYLMDQGKKRAFSDADTFNAWGYSWNDIRTYSDTLINSIPSGSSMSRLIKGSTAAVYRLDPVKKKRLIPNAEVFYSYGYDFKNVLTLSDSSINSFASGSILPPNTTPVKVTAGGKFAVESSSLGQIATSEANKVFEVRYLAGQYYVNNDNNCWMSSGYIRFLPLDNQAIMEVVSYSDPNWNGSINYNRFLGNIEVQYSSKSNALWVINELALEDYLKGIAESSNGDPSEYLKVMAVVARSYAYWHIQRGGKHRGEPFHLKNSRRGNGNDQDYRGYGFQSLAPNVTAAVNATSRQVVSGHGYSVCITPYSHGAQGVTRPGTAIGLDYPWLQSEADPYGDPYAGLNNPAGNHLVGLSASGARGYVNNKGESYTWILNHYFRGTGITTLSNPKIRVSIYGIPY